MLFRLDYGTIYVFFFGVISLKLFTRRACAVFLLLTVFLSCLPLGFAANDEEAVILFTHDLHDHFLPFTEGDGTEYLGYAALSATINQRQQKNAARALVVDGGDFSMGTLYQTIYSTHAPELDLLGAMGYDVTTVGNHEFDYRAEGFAQMLQKATEHDVVPQMVVGNYKPAEGTPASVQKAMNAYGVKEYTMIDRGSIRYAIFGINGIDSDACAPMSGFALEDPIEAAKRIVADIKANEQYDLLLCLSHSGTNPNPKKSEDELLAAAVPDIDVIISGHTHTTLQVPIVIGNTHIVSAGSYGKNLGEIALRPNGDRWTLARYDLIPLTADNDEITTLHNNYAVLDKIEAYQKIVSEEYLSQFHMTFDQVLTTSSFPIETQSGHRELPLGNLITDSYLYAIKQAQGDSFEKIDIAVVPNGVIRGAFSTGDITVSDAFNVSSLGYGADGSPGYPLISIYLTGAELEDVMEIDASVAPLMDTAQLYIWGLQYTFNPNRMIFDKVVAYNLIDEEGRKSALEEDKLYHVVAGLYSAQMLGSVKAQSFGLLSVEPKDKNGVPIEDFEAHIIYNADGTELKEWYALASYLGSFGEEGVPAKYRTGQGRKVVEDSKNPINLIKYPGLPTIIVLIIILVLLFLIIFVTHRIVTRRSRRRRRSGGYAGRRYRGR